MRIDTEREDDGRWIAEVLDVEGALAYGATRAEAVSRVEALVLRVLADKLDQGERLPAIDAIFAPA